MKSEKEVEKLKSEISDKICLIDTEYHHGSANRRDQLLEHKRQLMAQYNILLEVLK